jgi:drug/metabolite transporter (DMT)-like permease
MTDGGAKQADFRDPGVLIPFILITLIWSSTWIVIKDQLGVVPGPWSVAYRFALAGLVMAAAAAILRRPLRLGAGGHAFALALGLFQFVLNFNLVYAAEQYVTSGLVALVFALLIVPNTILARLFFRQPVSARFALGSGVAIAGLALLFLREVRGAAADAPMVLTGIGYTLIGVCCASAANVMQLAEPARRLPATSLLAWAMLYGAALDAAVAWAVHGPPVVEHRAGYWLGLLYLGTVATAGAFLLYYRLIRAIGPARSAYSSVLIPIFAMAISTAVEGYRWTPLAAAGVMLAIAGLVIALGSKRIAPVPITD